jgi:hypothetical protein
VVASNIKDGVKAFRALLQELEVYPTEPSILRLKMPSAQYIPTKNEEVALPEIRYPVAIFTTL